MKKIYLKIDVYRGDVHICETYHLLTDNVTGFLFEESTGETRLFFKNANPIAYCRIHLTGTEFLSLVREDKNICRIKSATKEGSMFNYSLVTL